MSVMELYSPISVIAAVAVIFLSVVYYFIKNRNVLPGPKGLPYIGLYSYLKDDTCHLQLQEIGEKYGDLYSFTFLGNLIINLGSVKAIREVHVNKSDCFAGRFTDFSILTYILEDGVAMVNGDAWKALRKYFIQAFKEYGLTVMKDNTAGPLYDTVAKTMEDLHSRNGEPFNVMDILVLRCLGTMGKVLFGEEGVSDKALLKMNEAYAVALEGMVGVNLLLIGPIGKYLFNSKPELKNALEQHKVMYALLMEVVKKIESSMDENHPTCIVEDYYRERNAKKQKNDPSWTYFTDKALVASIAQFVGDGILSVAYFIGCFLMALVEHPEEQNRIYKEIMEVVGPSRLPTIEDKSKLPYTIAFMNEVLRTSNFFTLFPSMACTKETTVRGYRIPKGSITMLNIWQAHHDPNTYEDPDTFNPSRYMATPGKPRAELPVNFGMGKRACTGEAFVMTKSFLFLTSIVKNFTISEPPNPKTKSNLFLMTGYMELCIVPRTEK